MYASVILVYWDYIYCHAGVYQDVSFSLRGERKWQLWAEGQEMSSERNGERDIEREVEREGGGYPPEVRMSFSHPDTTQ